MAWQWVAFVRCLIPLAGLVAFAVGVPLGVPAAGITGGVCGQQANPCASSTWQPCTPRVQCPFMQCECNAGGNGQCTNTTSCADLQRGCNPNVACRCSPLPLD